MHPIDTLEKTIFVHFRKLGIIAVVYIQDCDDNGVVADAQGILPNLSDNEIDVMVVEQGIQMAPEALKPKAAHPTKNSISQHRC